MLIHSVTFELKHCGCSISACYIPGLFIFAVKLIVAEPLLCLVL